MERGTVTSLHRFKQTVRFDGLVWDSISPTDIDAFIDFKRRLFVAIEVKYQGVPITLGQDIALRNLGTASRVPTVCLVANHTVPAHQDVYLAHCEVFQVCRAPLWTWIEQPSPLTSVKSYIDALRTEFKLENVKPTVHMKALKSEPPPEEIERQEREAIRADCNAKMVLYPPVSEVLDVSKIRW